MDQQDAGTADLAPRAIFDFGTEDRDPMDLRFAHVQVRDPGRPRRLYAAKSCERIFNLAVHARFVALVLVAT